MGFFDSGTISGVSRADGTTARTVTMNRVGSITNGFVARETGLSNHELAQTVTYRTFEEKARNGMRIRTSQSVWTWPYELASEPGVVAGVVTWNRNGLHVPANCPDNVRIDIRTQLGAMATTGSTSIGAQLVSDLLLNGIPAA
jgi:hypothetical protein